MESKGSPLVPESLGKKELTLKQKVIEAIRKTDKGVVVIDDEGGLWTRDPDPLMEITPWVRLNEPTTKDTLPIHACVSDETLGARIQTLPIEVIGDFVDDPDEDRRLFV